MGNVVGRIPGGADVADQVSLGYLDAAADPGTESIEMGVVVLVSPRGA